MSKPKIIDLLATFSPKEWSGFKKYLLHKTRAESENHRAFLYLEKERSRLDRFTVEKAMTKLFPTMTRKAFLNILSKLYGWLEEYLLIQAQAEHKIDKSILLIRSYNSRALYSEANRLALQIIEILEQDRHSLSSIEQIHQIYYLLYYSDNPLKFDLKFGLFDRLIESHKALCHIRSGFYELEMHNYGDVRNVDYSQDFEWISRVKTPALEVKESELISKLHSLVRYKGAHLFRQLIEEVKLSLPKGLSDLERYAISYLHIYSNRYYTRGLIEDIQLIREIIDLGLTSRVFMEQGYIPVIRFHNLVNAIAALSTWEETEDFISKWYSLVNSKHLDGTKALAEAQNAFYHQKYELIPARLRDAKVDDLFQKLKVNNLMLVGIYKAPTLDHELLFNACSNFKRMLRKLKDQISKKAYQSNYNFANVIMAMANQAYDKHPINLEKYEAVMYRKWLLDELK